MKPLVVKQDEFTPGVSFDPEVSVFEIYGFSRPESVVGFYKPLIEWLEVYKDTVLASNTQYDKSKLVLKLHMTYFNSASSKFLLEILQIFMKMSSRGNIVEVVWYYDADDEEILESGKELSELIDYPFTYVEVKN